jgi:UDP-sulfoquinovose synthase
MPGGERIIVLGGDGFCGWPTSLYLSQAGYEVVIVDNLSRRKIDDELGCQSLTPIQPMAARLAAWQELTGAASSSSSWM